MKSKTKIILAVIAAVILSGFFIALYFFPNSPIVRALGGTGFVAAIIATAKQKRQANADKTPTFDDLDPGTIAKIDSAKSDAVDAGTEAGVIAGLEALHSRRNRKNGG